MDDKNESEFSLENITNIKEEIETSLYCDSLGKKLQKENSLFPDFDTDIDSGNSVVPDEVFRILNKDHDNYESVLSEVIPPFPSKTTFLTNEMLKENQLFSKASDIDSSKQGSKKYLRPEIRSENLFKFASEISENLTYNSERGQENHSNDKEDEVSSQFSIDSEPIPYQGPTKGIFQELDTNSVVSSPFNFGIKPTMIPTEEFAKQTSCDISENNFTNNNKPLLPLSNSCTNLFQTASQNLKNEQKSAPLFPLSVKKNLNSKETANSSCLVEEEKENIENQVAADYNCDSTLNTKPKIKKPFKPIFKNPKRSIENFSSSQDINSTKQLSTSGQKDCLSALKDKEKEIESKNDQQLSISQVEVKKEAGIGEVNKHFDAKKKYFVAKNTQQQKVVSNVTDSNTTLSDNIEKTSKKIEMISPAKLDKHVDSFKKKFSSLYKSNVKKTGSINLPKKGKKIDKKVKKDKNVNKEFERVEDKTDEVPFKTPALKIKTIKELNSTLSIDHAVKCDSEDISFKEEIISFNKQNELVSNPQAIPNDESCLSTKSSLMNKIDDTDNFYSDSDDSETNSSSSFQGTSTEKLNCSQVYNSGTEGTRKEAEVTSPNKEVLKGRPISKELKKKRLGVVEGKDRNKKMRFLEKSKNVGTLEKVEEIKKKLYELQTKTTYPVWVRCDLCSNWRCLRDTLDPTTVPKMWICSMNEDENYNSCDAKAEEDDNENILYIYNDYSLGSLVWVTNQGPDWWPAMVDDCPDNHVHYWLEEQNLTPTQYHITFFGTEATRAWVETKFLRKFDETRRKTLTNDKKLRKEHVIAMNQALEANSIEISKRRKKYCFAARRKGAWFLKDVNKECTKRK